MRRLVGTCLLLSAIVGVPAAEVYAQKEKDKKKEAPKEAPKIDSSKLSGEFAGTLKSTPGSNRIFVLEAETQKLVPTGGKGGNPAGNANKLIQAQNQLAQDQQKLRAARNPQQANQIIQQMQKHRVQLQQGLAQMSKGGGAPAGYRIDTVKTEIEFQAAEGVKVRTLVPPEAFDDKGNPKKFSKADMAALKGKDTGMPGFESSLEKLESGQKIRVVLGPAPASEKKDVDKDDAKDADKRMQVKLIVVIGEGAAAEGKDKGKKKK